jgi:hypothetical protein
MRILSRPGEIDGLVRAWLAWRGWRAPTHVRDGVIWVGDRIRGEYLLDALDRTWSDWGNGAPRPTVDWPRNED